MRFPTAPTKKAQPLVSLRVPKIERAPTNSNGNPKKSRSQSQATSQAVSIPTAAQQPEILSQQLKTITELQKKVCDLENELKLSKLSFMTLASSHKESQESLSKKSRKAGHKEILSELEDLWRSEHFCLELLYGLILSFLA